MSLSFSIFIEQSLASHSYPLNGFAKSYLQDWYAGRAVATLDGGLAFEPQLRKLNLDGSLISLAHLDKFLIAVKPYLAPDYRLLPYQIPQKNLLIFIAFYIGMVWCYHAHTTPHWVSFTYLTQQYPALSKAIDDDFSYSVAISRLPIGENVDNRPLIMLGLNQQVFFPLVTVIERLYPRRQDINQSQAPFFGYINDSLEHSIRQLLLANDITPILDESPDLIPLTNHAIPQFIQPLPSSLSCLNKYLNIGKDFLFIDKKSLKIYEKYFDNANFETVRVDYQHPFLTEKPIENTTVPPTVTLETSGENRGQTRVEKTVNHTLADTRLINSEPKPSNISIKLPTNVTANVTAKKSIAFTAKQTAQNKRLEKQALEQQTQLAKQQREQKIAEALANPQLHEGLLQQRKSLIDQKRPKINDSFSELEQALTLIPTRQKMVESNQVNPQSTPTQSTPKSDLVLQAEQKAQALLASETQNAKRVAADTLSGKLLKKIPEINQLTEIGKPKALAMVDLLLADTHAVDPDATVNADLEATYYQACQTLHDLQQQSEPDSVLVKQTLSKLDHLAKEQHTGALLQLALLRFRGEPTFGVIKDDPQALTLVQTAAKCNDNRAQKLLSKLYFSGQHVPLSTELGNFWLEQAASHGNLAAQQLLADMAIAQQLRHTQQNDKIYRERLLMGVGILVIFMLAIIFLVKV